MEEVVLVQTVGEVLRQEREKKGLTVKDIEAGTSIRALYISAIEDNNFSVVPGEVYLKGFIRNYANYLGLNGQDIVELYRQNQNPLPKADPIVVDSHLTAKKPSEQRRETKETTTNEAANSSASKWLIGVLAVCLVGGAGWWFVFGAGKPATPQPSQQPAKTSPIIPAQPTVPQTPIVPAQPVPKTKPVTVAVKVSDDCWAQILADGKEVYEGILKPGESKTWEAEQTIVVKLGNAGAAELSHNGQIVGKLGATGEVVSRTFTK